MSNSDNILELLEEIRPKAYCDDCLSNELKIKPRQQVNQICRKLANENKINRTKATCDSCVKEKLVNQSLTQEIKKDEKKLRKTKLYYCLNYVPGQYHYEYSFNNPEEIELCRSSTVKICKEIWSNEISDPAPRSISAIINLLKEKNIIPFHQANMMLTICGLRNAIVYEDVKIGQEELEIARNAWKVVEKWWRSVKGSIKRANN